MIRRCVRSACRVAALVVVAGAVRAQPAPDAVVMVDRPAGRGPPAAAVMLSADGLVVVPAEAVSGARTVTVHFIDQSTVSARVVHVHEETGLALLAAPTAPAQPTVRFHDGKPLEKGAVVQVRGVEGGLAWQSARATVVSTQTGPWGNLTSGYLTLDGDNPGTGADTGAPLWMPDGTLAAVHVGRLRVEGAPPARFVAVTVDRLRAFLAVAARGLPVARLCATTDMPGAQLFLDGKARGKLPVTLGGLDAGWHAVRVEAAGFAPQERLVQAGLEEGACLRFDARPAGGLAFKTNVPGVEVSVDGAPATPLGTRELYLPDGEHAVRFVARGYRVQSWAGRVTRGQVHAEAVTLVREHGLLSVTSAPEGATVLVEGREAGVTPLRDLKLAPGRWKVELRLAHHHPLSAGDVDIQDGAREDLGERKLAPLPARLSLAQGSVESGDEVYLNGRRVAGRSWKVEPGYHDVEIRRAWHLPAKARLQVQADEERSVSLRPELTSAGRTRWLKLGGGVAGVLAGVTGVVVAVAAVAGGATLLAGARVAYDDYMRQVAQPGLSSRYWLANGLMWSGLGIGGASVLCVLVAIVASGGAVWAFVTLPGDPSRATPRPEPTAAAREGA